MTASIGPTVRRRRLGTELRRLREAHSIKLEEVADKLGLAASTLSRIETGKAPTRTAYLGAMLDLYGVTDPGQRQILIDMAREGHRKGWWAAWEDVLPTGFDVYVGLEAEAASLRAYESLVVHGLLQTEAYARVVMTTVRRRQTPDQIERLVALLQAASGTVPAPRPDVYVVVSGPQAAVQALELVEDHNQVVRELPQRDQLGVEHLRVLRWSRRWPADRALDDLDVEADLFLERADLALGGAAQALDRVRGHGVVNATDEARKADHALEVDLDDVERRRVVPVRLGEL